MRLPYTHYSFARPETISEDLFLAFKRHPKETRDARLKAIVKGAKVAALRSVVVMLATYLGWRWLTEAEGLVGSLLGLGLLLLALSQLLSVATYLAYVLGHLEFWSEVAAAAKANETHDSFLHECKRRGLLPSDLEREEAVAVQEQTMRMHLGRYDDARLLQMASDGTLSTDARDRARAELDTRRRGGVRPPAV